VYVATVRLVNKIIKLEKCSLIHGVIVEAETQQYYVQYCAPG
jgi:hypothetical protein